MSHLAFVGVGQISDGQKLSWLWEESIHLPNAVTAADMIVCFSSVHKFREDVLDMWAC